MPPFNDVRIVDFKAIPSKATYILSVGSKGYFVQNRDSNQKDSDGNSKERRVTLGRLTHSWDFDKKQFRGLTYLGPGELFEVEGELHRNQGGYAIKDEELTDITPTEMPKFFAKPLLQQLEHYMVPEIMADCIRKNKTVTRGTLPEEKANQHINFGKIRVENLAKRPDRMIYMLADTTSQTKPEQQPKFVVINNDSDMDESWQLDHNWKSAVDSQKTRRHITVANMIDKNEEQKFNLCEGLRDFSSKLFMGFGYPTSLYNEDGGDILTKKIKEEIGEKRFAKEYPVLYPVGGRIEGHYCYKPESEKNIAYTTTSEMPVEEKTSEIAKLLTPALLQHLERFTVPHEMAVQIRKHANS